MSLVLEYLGAIPLSGAGPDIGNRERFVRSASRAGNSGSTSTPVDDVSVTL
jgi:hypothetical protein